MLKTSTITIIMDKPLTEATEKILSAVAGIISETEEELDKDGSRFNIFNILNLKTSEVRLHSAFIAELLDPGGTHSFKTEFLELFIKYLKEQKFGNHRSLLSFDISSGNVEVEKWVGFINEDYTRGGKIDLVISDNLQNRIIVENKITADDQPKQLLRYHNFDPNALLLYLTLSGEEPSIDSTGGILTLNEDFFLLSYEDFVLHWLLKCHEIASEKPKVEETLSQYMNLIKDYTSQSPNHKMNEKIVDLLKQNREFYSAVEEINKAYQAFNKSITSDFWEKLQVKIPNPNKLITLKNGTDIFYRIDQDADGFFFGFYIMEVNSKEDCLLPQYEPIVSALKEITPRVGNNNNYIRWIFPESLPCQLEQLPRGRFFELQYKANMDLLINQIADEFNQVKEKVMNRLEKL